MNFYRFTNTEGARAVQVLARNTDEAWQKLRKTHEYFFHRTDWKMLKRGEP